MKEQIINNVTVRPLDGIDIKIDNENKIMNENGDGNKEEIEILDKNNQKCPFVSVVKDSKLREPDIEKKIEKEVKKEVDCEEGYKADLLVLPVPFLANKLQKYKSIYAAQNKNKVNGNTIEEKNRILNTGTRTSNCSENLNLNVDSGVDEASVRASRLFVSAAYVLREQMQKQAMTILCMIRSTDLQIHTHIHINMFILPHVHRQNC